MGILGTGHLLRRGQLHFDKHWKKYPKNTLPAIQICSHLYTLSVYLNVHLNLVTFLEYSNILAYWAISVIPLQVWYAKCTLTFSFFFPYFSQRQLFSFFKGLSGLCNILRSCVTELSIGRHELLSKSTLFCFFSKRWRSQCNPFDKSTVVYAQPEKQDFGQSQYE